MAAGRRLVGRDGGGGGGQGARRAYQSNLHKLLSGLESVAPAAAHRPAPQPGSGCGAAGSGAQAPWTKEVDGRGCRRSMGGCLVGVVAVRVADTAEQLPVRRYVRSWVRRAAVVAARLVALGEAVAAPAAGLRRAGPREDGGGHRVRRLEGHLIALLDAQVQPACGQGGHGRSRCKALCALEAWCRQQLQASRARPLACSAQPRLFHTRRCAMGPAAAGATR